MRSCKIEVSVGGSLGERLAYFITLGELHRILDHDSGSEDLTQHLTQQTLPDARFDEDHAVGGDCGGQGVSER